MPDLVNTRSHAVRVRDENGELVRVRPGQVVSVDGATADNLSGLDGVETANQEHKDAWERHRGGVDYSGPSRNAPSDRLVADMRRAVALGTVAAPLNTVIGDDDAPYGPPSGTITTKQAVAREGGDEKKAFADHEWNPEDKDARELSEVEAAQAENREKLEEVHNEMLDVSQEEGSTEEQPQEQPTVASRSRKAKTEE